MVCTTRRQAPSRRTGTAALQTSTPPAGSSAEGRSVAGVVRSRRQEDDPVGAADVVSRFVTDWAGPRALVRGVSIRLGVPAYPYDDLTFTGAVTETVDVDGSLAAAWDAMAAGRRRWRG